MGNFAFIDAQNVHLGIRSLGWDLDWRKFRIYLTAKYRVTAAYIFIGFIESNQNLYSVLRSAGYILVFKPVVLDAAGNAKGNCDADLVLQAVVEKENYDKAVIVSSDGDFYSLVRYLYQQEKLAMVLSPHAGGCSRLLKREAKERINYMSNLDRKMRRK